MPSRNKGEVLSLPQGRYATGASRRLPSQFPGSLEGRTPSAVPTMFEPDAFLECVEWRLRAETRHGTLAYIEIQDPYIVGSSDRRGIASPSTATHDEISYLISETIGQDEVFCWQDGRFILLFADAAT